MSTQSFLSRFATKVVFLLSLPVAVASTGCGSATDEVSSAIDDVNIHGTWTGTWTGEGTNTGPATLTLEQKGLTVRGTLELKHNQCISVASVVGRIDDDGFSGEVTAGAMSVHFSGDVDLEEILGVYDALSTGPCPGERGNVRLFK
jgi:hypothetical protein